MRVVHLTASAMFGGPERQMLGLAGALPAEYVSTFLSFSENRRCRPFLSAVRAAGFDGAELRNDTPSIGAAIREVAIFLRGNLADVLVTHGYKSNLLGRPAARRAGIPVVSVSRGWTGEDLKVRCYETLDRLHLRFMDRVVCVSEAQAAKVRRTGVSARRIRVIRNCARLRAFAAPLPSARDRLRELAGGEGPVVLAAGRLSPEKGFAVLVEAIPHIQRHVPGVRFVLCGDGAERSGLERRAAELGMAEVLRMPGFRADLDALLPWSSVVALPSFSEGLPNVALEAAAAGVPVVATAVGGTPEVVADGQTGYLVAPGDPDSLAGRIIELLQSPQRRAEFGKAAQRRMHTEFSFAGQAAAYQALFAELVSGQNRRTALPEVACA